MSPSHSGPLHRLTLAIVLSVVVTTGIGLGVIPAAAQADSPTMRVLVFTRTEGYRHASITAGVAAVRELGLEYGFHVHRSEDPTIFTDDDLKPYQVVIFLNTSGSIFNDAQRRAFERFISEGKGFVGIHSAADTEYEWDWYRRLVGSSLNGHPEVQDAVVNVIHRDHRSTRHLPSRWERRDEWYNFRSVPSDVTILATLDVRSFEGSSMGSFHPIAWYHRFGGGRSWYTGGGHTPESFRDPLFREHLLGGILWAAGE